MVIHAAIIVDAISQVGILLDFAQRHAGPNGVRRACGYKKCVPKLHPPMNKQLLELLSFDAFHEFLPVGPWHEAKEDLRARFGGDGVPHFRLSAPTRSLLVGRSIIIVGMHLDGEFVIGENEFNKDGKIVWLFESCSAPLWRHLS